MRLKLKDQSSGGPVEEVEVTGGAEKTVTVSYYLQNLTCAMIWYGHTFMFKGRGSGKK